MSSIREPFTIRERWAIWIDRRFRYPIERLKRGEWAIPIARRLPRKVTYWAAIGLLSAGIRSNEHPDQVTIVTALKRWENPDAQDDAPDPE